MWIRTLSSYIFLTILLLRTKEGCSRVVKFTCGISKDCPMNAKCESGICFCNDGYIDEYRQETLVCLKEASSYGDVCETDLQCQGLLGLRSYCMHNNTDNAVGTCICSDDSHYKGGICHRNSYIGDKCKVSDDCVIRTKGVNSYCDKEKCICPPRYVASEDKSDCIPTAGLDDRCHSDNVCLVPNSHCNQYCQCKMWYVPSSDNLHCLKAAKTLNDGCTEDSQCTEFLKFSRCDFNINKCTCQNFTHRLDDQCWMSVALDELCEDDKDCVVQGERDGVGCHKGFCKCKEGYNKQANSCILINQARMDLQIGSNSNKISSFKAASLFMILIFALSS